MLDTPFIQDQERTSIFGEKSIGVHEAGFNRFSNPILKPMLV